MLSGNERRYRELERSMQEQRAKAKTDTEKDDIALAALVLYAAMDAGGMYGDLISEAIASTETRRFMRLAGALNAECPGDWFEPIGWALMFSRGYGLIDTDQKEKTKNDE